MSEQLYGAETAKAVANFPISGERVPLPVVHWQARIKGAAAQANAKLGKLDAELADRIAGAADSIALATMTTSSRSTSSRPARAPPPT